MDVKSKVAPLGEGWAGAPKGVLAACMGSGQERAAALAAGTRLVPTDEEVGV